ncbi:MAG: septum formation initiator family protein [Alphaproteobacteria bacterium]|nr:septum formation initiator family protein [Alphaproteobacteria bacterium]
MEFLWDIQNKLKKSGLWLLGPIVMCYFIYHTISGDRGLLKYIYLKQEIVKAEKVAEQYSLQKKELEEKVKHLSNASLDLDLLEERARIVLNMANDDEFILLDEED